jgi:hypothetical protein
VVLADADAVNFSIPAVIRHGCGEISDEFCVTLLVTVVFPDEAT